VNVLTISDSFPIRHGLGLPCVYQVARQFAVRHRVTLLSPALLRPGRCR
jgi:hypothetical protein